MFAIISVGLLAAVGTFIAHGYVAHRGVEIETADGSRRLTSNDVAALADGRDPDGEATLRAWIQPKIEIRRVLAREQLGNYLCSVAMAIPNGLASDLWWHARLEVSVDDGPWKPLDFNNQGATRWPFFGAGGGISVEFPLSSLLGDVSAPRTLALKHRATLSVGRGDAGDMSIKPGTTASWEDTRTVFLYDRFPDDYPEQVHDADIDRAMLSALTPEIVYSGVGVSSFGRGTKTLRLDLDFPPHGRLLPVAGTIELSEPGSDTPFAREHIKFDATADGLFAIHGASYNLEPLAPEREAQLLLALESGKLDHVRFVFRSSRDVALSRTRFDRIWSGSVDVVVPLTRER